MVRKLSILFILIFSVAALGQLSSGSLGQGVSSTNAKGLLGFGLVTSAAPSYTNGTMNGLSLDELGNLRVVTSGSLSVTFPSVQGVSQVGVWRTEVSGTPSVSVTNQITGYATSALQTTGNTYLQSIDSFVSSALDANLSTRASEATLSAASAKLPASLGAKTGANSLSVVPSTDGVFNVSGTLTANPSGTQNVAFVSTPSVSAGQVTVLQGTSPWVVSAGTVAITAASLPTHAVTQSGAWTFSLGSVSTTGVLAVSSTGVPVFAMASETTKVIGTVNQGTSPWTVSGSVSLNGVQPVSATIGNTITVNTHAVTGSGTFTTSGTQQLTAGSAFIGVVSATVLPNGVFTVSAGTVPVTFSGTQTTSGTVQLTAGSATIGSIANTGFNATVLNSLGIASGSVSVLNSLGIASGTVTANAGSGTFAVSGTVSANPSGTYTVSFASTPTVSAGQVTVLQGTTPWVVSTGQTIESRPATATQTKLTGSTTSATCLSSNSARRGATFFNASSANMFIFFGATASATSMTYYAVPSATVEVHYPAYTGVISCIWDASQGFGYVTEY